MSSPNGNTVFPLLKTMNVRDTSKYEFEVIKYNYEELAADPLLFQEAYDDINYDQFLRPKKAFQDRIEQECSE